MKRIPYVRKSWTVSNLFAVMSMMLLGWLVIPAPAMGETSCDPQSPYYTSIGLEYVFKNCVPSAMNDNINPDTYDIVYIINTLECSSSKVVLADNSGGDTWYENPAMIIAKFVKNGYRVYRNKEGTHILIVQKSYNGLIDGRDVGNDSPGVYVDAFKEGFILPQTPKCRGGDYNTSGCGANSIEKSSASTVNLGTGRLSHSQELFTLSGGNYLPLGVSLYYRSLPLAPSAIGNGWSHSYEATLAAGSGGSMIFWNAGKRTVYNKYTTAYVPPKGDTSSLVKNADTSWTISERDGLKRNFDPAGKLTSIVDRFGNSLTFSYDSGKLTAVSDGNGRSITFGYKADGKLETVTDPKGSNSFIFTYTGDKLTSVTPPGSTSQWVYSYAANGLLETKTDPENNASSYTYFDNNQLKTAKDPLMMERAYSYPTSTELGGVGKIPDCYPLAMVSQLEFTLAEKDLNSWSYTYDTLTMKIRTATDPLGNTTTYYYNPDGTMRAVTKPFDGATKFTTFYTYDGFGNLLTQTDPVDISGYSPAIDPQTVNIASLASLSPPIKTALRYTYDTANYDRILSVSDERSTPFRTISLAYTVEGGGEVITATLPWGNVVAKRNPDGSVREYTDANGKITLFSYYPVSPENIAAGSAGQLLKITGPDGVSVTFTLYDKNGNPREVELSDSNGVDRVVTSLDHDALNRLKTLTGIASGLPANVTNFDYDLVGNLKSIVDAESHETKYEYTYDRQLKKISNVVNGLPVETVFEYSGSGCSTCGGGVDKLTAVKDPNQVKNNLPGTVYQYDAAGRLEYETDPVGKKLRYTYYDNGLVREKYDATTTQTLLVTYTYNNRGQLENKLFTDGTYEHYSYFPDGKLETAANQHISYTYAYYDNGRLKSVTDSQGNKINYDEYDGLGQRKKVTWFPGASDEHVITYDYDAANRPWHISASEKTNTIGTGLESPGSFTFAYDNLGRRESQPDRRQLWLRRPQPLDIPQPQA